MKARYFFLVLIPFVLWGLVWFIGSRNPETPAGYVGYLTQGAVFGQQHFVGLQKGPTSPGRNWMYDVTNISITPYTYDEDFEGQNSVLSKDNLKISFKMHVVWAVDETAVQIFVEKYSILLTGNDPEQVVRAAYNNNIREPFRTMSRDEIQRFKGLELKDNIKAIGSSITDALRELTKGTPFVIKGAIVGNIQYPTEIADAVSKKLAATQDLERKQTEIFIEEKEAQKRVAQATGIAKSMDVINQKLTPLYVQHEAIDAQKAMVGSPNHTVIYIPVGANGVPIVGNLDLSNGAQKEK